jgi:hypothetical protein
MSYRQKTTGSVTSVTNFKLVEEVTHNFIDNKKSENNFPEKVIF